MKEDFQKSFLEADVDHDHCVLTGNRPGLGLLRDAITRLLDGGEKSALIDEGQLGVELVVLNEETPVQPIIPGWKERLLIYLYLIVFCIFLAATVFGFYHLIKLFI
ncbi:hypothetical protein JIN84_07625 [Luteolibacter yonseiensis]|uniref:Uncharacterized protein n=1 Tax=Luteolibacter yonseiensis TaxID=1144680 RepID=A0A934QZA4_9BACT|nr:hypothetical protein [Luteolibacter yonseiensis]MBK1815478.1 hypothetical protein [Luteolibacter yonseiensis]